MRGAPKELGFTVAGSLMATLIRRAQEHGVSPEALLGAVDVSPSTLSDPSLRVPRRAYHRAFELAAELSGLPDFGLLCGERTDLDTFHIVGYVLAGQQTLVDVLRRLCGLHRLLDDAAVNTIRHEEGRVNFVTQERVRALTRPRQAAEFAVAAFVTQLRARTGSKFSPLRVCFMHPRPKSLETHYRVLRVLPEFDCEATEVAMDPSTAMESSAVSPPGLTQLLERFAGVLLEQVPPDDFTSRVVQVIRAQLSSSSPSIHKTAHLMGMSTRTLQRRLAEAGETFLSVVDRVRQDVARFHLEQSDATLEQIAASAGYMDARSLRRAAHRWFGAGAGSVRRQKQKHTSNPRAR